ncbi:MAG: aldehyde dehydrogenase family protein [Bacillales bacterium]|jgi:aldehyde dehydrogenase (NAD+)|nr:aldehyde dehydrogenase family protein [Bacillales bacterium]
MNLDNLYNFYESGVTLSVKTRLFYLKSFLKSIKKNEEYILEGLKKDLGKSFLESYQTELTLVYEELHYFIRHLKHLSKPKRVPTGLINIISKGYVYSQPYGVVLIITPWNYPVNLSLVPLIASLSAGNVTLLKLSEYCPNVNKALIKAITETFDSNYVKVVEGGRTMLLDLLETKFNYIFFTGSATVGKIVMEKASVNLTPITLELGGKSPCIVDKTANLKVAGRRIAWGKLINSGQTCVAPDYLLVEESIKNKLFEEIKKNINEFYDEPLLSDDYPKMISKRQFERAIKLLENQKIICGGKSDINKLKIEPTFVEVNDFNSPLMQEEIFAPILPIMTFKDFNEVIPLLKPLEMPLALYLFSNNTQHQKDIIEQLRFGSGAINDCVMQIASNSLPFGGVGNSGMGNYHGKYGFQTFSRSKGILKKATYFDINLRYLPSKNKLKAIKNLIK